MMAVFFISFPFDLAADRKAEAAEFQNPAASGLPVPTDIQLVLLYHIFAADCNQHFAENPTLFLYRCNNFPSDPQISSQSKPTARTVRTGGRLMAEQITARVCV
ncbi:MAG: hypothetical protein IJW62_03420 [Clostridia bacterium]|nr:hypothetical protein [Clostridia bacterium]